MKHVQEASNLKLWCDGLKLDTGVTGAAVAWKTNRNSKEWQELKISLGQNIGDIWYRNVGHLRSF